nr:hypothetical protein [Tanacetum cinerariifolium]
GIWRAVVRVAKHEGEIMTAFASGGRDAALAGDDMEDDHENAVPLLRKSSSKTFVACKASSILALESILHIQ